MGVRRIFLAIFLALCLILTYIFLVKKPFKQVNKNYLNEPSSATAKQGPTEQAKNSDFKEIKSVFVPYWNLDNLDKLSIYDRIFYFGITPSTPGINQEDEGYQKLEKLVNGIPQGKKTYITLIFHESDLVKTILGDQKLQEKLQNDTLDLVNRYNLSGVLIDLEINDFLNDSTKDQINNFVKTFYTGLKNDNRSLIIALYGDLFYRHRPFDLKFLNNNSDEIMVMAYDFHKASGEPGPNFPLTGRDDYGYDLKEMVEDFTKYVPEQKLSVAFGFYGYAWEVNEKKQPLKPAKALSYLDIKKQFLDSCSWKDCLVRRDDQSAETEIDYVTDYTDPDPVTNPDKLVTPIGHIIWFEDQQSVDKKIEYLKSQGIGSVAYWVWGYF